MLLSTSEAEFGQASIVDAGASGAIAGAVTTGKVHLSVDQVVVSWWSNKAFVCEISPHDTFEDGEVVCVVVVIERHWTKIDVVWVV